MSQTAPAPGSAPRQQYTGLVFDAETGFAYAQARYYNAGTGRFISADPSGFAGGSDMNLYRYVGNNPLTHTDPTGLCGRSLLGSSYNSFTSSYSSPLPTYSLSSPSYSLSSPSYGGSLSLGSSLGLGDYGWNASYAVTQPASVSYGQDFNSYVSNTYTSASPLAQSQVNLSSPSLTGYDLGWGNSLYTGSAAAQGTTGLGGWTPPYYGESILEAQPQPLTLSQPTRASFSSPLVSFGYDQQVLGYMDLFGMDRAQAASAVQEDHWRSAVQAEMRLAQQQAIDGVWTKYGACAICHGSPDGRWVNLASGLDNRPMPMDQFLALQQSAVETPLVWRNFTRAIGALRAVGGGIVAAAGFGLSDTGLGAIVGVPLMLWGGDQVVAGSKEVWNGTSATSYGGQAIQYVAGDGLTGQALTFAYDTLPSFAAVNPRALAIRIPFVSQEAKIGFLLNEASKDMTLSRFAPVTALDYFRATAEIEGAPASTPVGRLGQPMNVPRGTNPGTTIGGRNFGGHAIDQMQGRGVVPSAVENTIQTGTRSLDPIPGRLRYYDFVNNLTVITESDGTVVTVITGQR